MVERVPCAFAGLHANGPVNGKMTAGSEIDVVVPVSSLLLCTRKSPRAFAGGFSVFAGVGERTREGNDLYKEMIESVSFNPLGGCRFLGQEGASKSAQLDITVARDSACLPCRVSSSWVTRRLSPSAHWCTGR